MSQKKIKTKKSGKVRSGSTRKISSVKKSSPSKAKAKAKVIKKTAKSATGGSASGRRVVKKKTVSKKVSKKSVVQKKPVKRKSTSRKKVVKKPTPQMIKKGNGSKEANSTLYSSGMGLDVFNIADLPPFDDAVFNAPTEVLNPETTVAVVKVSSKLSFFVGLFFGAIVLHALLLSILVFIST